MLKILLECTKNMFASKGTWTGESERLKARSRGESTEKGRGKAEIQSEHLPLSKKHSQGKQSACFSAEEVRRLQGGWGAQRKAAKFRKREEQRTVRASLRTEKAKAESFECGSAASGRHKKFRPSAAEASAQLRCKSSKKAKGILLFLRLVLRHCRWLSMTLSKLGSAFPKDPSEQKSGS